MSDYKIYNDLHKPGCIDYLHRLVVYYFCEPTDNDKNRIVIHVFLVGRHRQSCLNRGWCKSANKDED